MININEISLDDFNTPDKMDTFFEDYMKEHNLVDICKHNILNIVQHSKIWKFKELKKIIRYMSFYKPDHDSIYLLYRDQNSPQMGCIEILNFKMFKILKKEFQKSSLTLFDNR